MTASLPKKNALEKIHDHHRRIEVIFTVALALLVLVAIVLPMFSFPGARLASMLATVSISMPVCLFCRARAGACANSLAISMHLEKKDFEQSCRFLKSSECLKNMDAFASTLLKMQPRTQGLALPTK